MRCNDLLADERWPRFGSAASAEGINSSLSFQLFTYGKCRAALNLFGRNRNAFNMEAEAIAGMLATHAATALIVHNGALIVHNKELQFRSALASRDAISQAKGMIMERFNVDAIRAFELMVRVSQNSNTRVADLAQEIVA